ncbi:uncharacterized protein [Spinacia oleracea]|uniref:Splicing factor YJU2 n=1 Tax=Spinacia oleracea TaxID=3562 RepID=A0ABM3RFV6_SPIOL|nr:uncharacterized protein LOC110797041 isoform X1 [Spinacia oleracea]
MGERKVLNKYYPADFDPAKLPRRRQPQNHQIKVRMMLPMSIRCCSCGNYMYQGTKFNSRKEDVIREIYLGMIKVFRFYIKCTNCSSEITMKTDPKNSDYLIESGATRNFEPSNPDKEIDDFEEDKMKSIEIRARELKRQAESVASIEELRSMKSRHEVVNLEAGILDFLHHQEKKMDDKLMFSPARPTTKQYPIVPIVKKRKVNEDAVVSFVVKKRKPVQKPKEDIDTARSGLGLLSLCLKRCCSPVLLVLF